MTLAQNIVFDSLLNAWNSHERLRREGANTAQLVASRERLDRARYMAATAIR